MKILVIGGDGREHALVWKLRTADANHQVYCAPGNAGIAAHLAGVLAARMLAVQDEKLREQLEQYAAEVADAGKAKHVQLQEC